MVADLAHGCIKRMCLMLNLSRYIVKSTLKEYGIVPSNPLPPRW